MKGLRHLSRGAKIVLGTFGVLVATSAAGAMTSPPPAEQASPPAQQPAVASLAPAPQAAVKAERTVIESKTEPVPYESTTQNDPTMPAGTSVVATPGVNGVRTRSYQVTYLDSVETGRVEIANTITTQPVTQVTKVGTKQPEPTCANGTYVNSSGQTVCSPYAAPTEPEGATARCADGTYSFSQSRRGTCSHHGGVARWL